MSHALIWAALATPPPVVGGAPAPAGKWPSAAALVYEGFTDCSAVLVAPDVVLTAGHCVGEDIDEVRFGVDHQAPDLVAAVRSWHAFPDYDDANDVGLLLLEAPVDRPVPPLLLGCAVGYLTDGARAQVVGYGNLEEDGGGPTSLQYEVEVAVTDADCSTSGEGCRSAAGPDGELIAGGDGADSCSGDSGGPLYVWGDGVPYLAGVTSRAAASGTRPCGDGGIYSRLDAVAAWIEETAEVELPEPDCDGWENAPPTGAAPGLVAKQGQVVEQALTAEDPDTGQTLSWRVGQDTSLGRTSIEGERLRFEAHDAGTDVLQLVLTDGVVDVPIDVDVTVTAYADIPVIEAEPRFGCRTVPSPGWFWIVALVALSPRWLRSRRPAD